MSLWGWLDNVKQFVLNVFDRVLGRDAEKTVVNVNIDINRAGVMNVTQQLIDDQITVGVWQAQMRDILKTEYIQQYLLGIGGQSQLSSKDYGSIGGMLRDQYKYLANFAQEIADGKLTPGQVMMRAQMYANSARESFGRARARAYGIPDKKLPAVPGDGSTVCLTNCACFWDFEEVFENNEFVGWNCYWALGPAEHCPDCLERSQKWNPLFIPVD